MCSCALYTTAGHLFVIPRLVKARRQPHPALGHSLQLRQSHPSSHVHVCSPLPHMDRADQHLAQLGSGGNMQKPPMNEACNEQAVCTTCPTKQNITDARMTLQNKKRAQDSLSAASTPLNLLIVPTTTAHRTLAQYVCMSVVHPAILKSFKISWPSPSQKPKTSS